MSGSYALRSLAQRYNSVFLDAWKERKAVDATAVERRDAEFLPSALALRDTPVHPLPRYAAIVICTLVLFALAWAWLGKVDMVASAPGKILPNGDVKTIQPQDTAVITAIHVRDGQKVQRGEVLVDLDATDSETDGNRAQADLQSVNGEMARARAMLVMIETGKKSSIDNAASLGASAAVEAHVLEGELADYQSNMARLGADVDQARGTLAETNEEINKLQRTLPIEQQKERDYSELIKKGYVGKHDYYNEQQAVIQIEQDLAGQRARKQESAAALASAIDKRTAYLADARRTWLEKLHDDTDKAAGLEQEVRKDKQHGQLMQLRSPIDGFVQHLDVHTVGGVVTPAQALMTIVPSDGKLIVQAIVDNQDIGFVHEGQAVEVKVETFPFTRYGTLHGTVVQVSNDARADDKLGLIFSAEVSLPRDTMQVDDRIIHLSPGMAVTAEIKTGQRRVINYLLSPLIQHANESMHER